MSNRINLTTNFYKDEFACRCGCATDEVELDFLYKLQVARTLAGIPFHISSGTRCVTHNKNVGGSQNSSHLIGRAADISYTSSSECYTIVSCLARVGFSRIGIAENFIHVDDDPFKETDVLWTY